MQSVNVTMSYSQAMALYGALDGNAWDGTQKLSEEETEAVQAVIQQLQEQLS